jgi:hypothetical protein
MISFLLMLAALLQPTPAAPPGVHKAVLNWGASNQHVNYRVHRGTKSGGPYTEIASGIKGLTYTDWAVVAGKTYFYVVDARNPDTNIVSKFSSQAKAVIP